jgi:hypothetical protein
MQRPVLAGDCARAAYDLTRYLGISHAFWAEACAVLGQQAAAMCVVLIDYAVQREDNLIRKPQAYCLQLGGAKPPPLGGSFSRFCVDWGT